MTTGRFHGEQLNAVGNRGGRHGTVGDYQQIIARGIFTGTDINIPSGAISIITTGIPERIGATGADFFNHHARAVRSGTDIGSSRINRSL